MTQADVGVFGGSGFYAFLDDVEEVQVTTPYGEPSAPVAIGRLGEVRVAFIPRHGRTHEFPPHRVNYRANVAAMRELGVRALLGPFAAGSLQPSVRPGDFVIGDGDGVVVVEREKIESLLPLAAKKVRDEAARIAAIKEGDTAAKWLDSALRAAGVLKEGETL